VEGGVDNLRQTSLKENAKHSPAENKKRSRSCCGLKPNPAFFPGLVPFPGDKELTNRKARAAAMI
jgi:hypothetical protein